jgi:hypothetical protein
LTRDLDLQPVAPVVLPDPGDPHALALLEVRDRPDQDDLVPVAVAVEHGEAGLVARPAPAHDQHLVLERGAWGAFDHGLNHMSMNPFSMPATAPRSGSVAAMP